MDKVIDNIVELLEIYDLSGNYLKTLTRGEFKKEAETLVLKHKGKQIKNNIQVKRCMGLILTPDGNILLQKRSQDKNENPGMYDKSVGGHTTIMEYYTSKKGLLSDELSDMNMSKEFLEELRIPTLPISNNFFLDALSFGVTQQGMITRLGRVMGDESIRIYKDGTQITQPYISDVYMGYYDGPIQFIDGEASGIENVKISTLLSRIEKYPELYTEDLKGLVKRYQKFLVPLAEFQKVFSDSGSTFV